MKTKNVGTMVFGFSASRLRDSHALLLNYFILFMSRSANWQPEAVGLSGAGLASSFFVCLHATECVPLFCLRYFPKMSSTWGSSY